MVEGDAPTPRAVEASLLSDLQPEDQPCAEVEPSGWSQTRAARRKQKARKRNNHLLVQDAIQCSDLSDTDDLSDLAATDDEHSSEQHMPAQATQKQRLQPQTPGQQSAADAATADLLSVQKAGTSRTAGRLCTRASRFGGKKKPWLQTNTDTFAEGAEMGSGRDQAPASPRIKAAQPDPEFLALVSLLFSLQQMLCDRHTQLLSICTAFANGIL